jgi:Carboxypeptidase regulatory-like domain
MHDQAPRLIRAPLWVCFAMAGALAPSAWQQPQAPSVVRGRVVAADTNLPFRDVTVSLQPLASEPPSSGREAMGASMMQGGTLVDAEGRFEFPDVRAGSYLLVATPLATARRYLPGFFPDPSTDGPRSFRVVSGQSPAEIVIPLPRGAAISGRVVDENGVPQSLVSVSARELLAAGRTRAAAGFGATTDDNGSFRLFGLRAGEYIVVAQLPPEPTGMTVGPPRSAIQPPTYYPSARSVSEAGKLRVRSGDDQGPIEIVLQRSRLLTIRGVVVDSNGSPVPRSLVRLQKPTSPIVNDSVNISRPTTDDGAFEIRLVAPGEYALTASRYGGPWREFAWTPITVTTDMEGVTVRLQATVNVDGQVIFDTPPSGSVASLRIRAVEGAGGVQSPAIQVKDDGSFSLEHLFGAVVLRAEGWKGWQIKSVLYGGRDITDEPTELAPGTELRVIVSERLGTLAGVVRTERGDPDAAAVLMFAEDPAFRHERSTMTKMVYAAANGRYVVDGLRPGRYIAVAVPRQAASLTDVTADYYELLARHGKPIAIRDREAEALDLTVFSVR